MESGRGVYEANVPLVGALRSGVVWSFKAGYRRARYVTWLHDVLLISRMGASEGGPVRVLRSRVAGHRAADRYLRA